MFKSKYILISLLSFLFIMPNAHAADYVVKMVTNTSNNKTIGTYNSYSEAVKIMNQQNSTSTSVASVYKGNKIINSKYAIFRFSPSNGTTNIYQNEGDSVAYSYTNPSSMTDTAFINSNEKKVQVVLNGLKGWIDINTGNIIPISLLGGKAINITASGLRMRSSTSTSSSVVTKITCTNTLFTYSDKMAANGYTWYKISYNGKTGWVASGSWLAETTGNNLNTYYYNYSSSGNLLHRYAYHNGTSYTDNFTNLGPSPSYLTKDVHYYSFDGIYFYTNLTTMLDDYKNNRYTNSINANNPNYSYYLYLPNKSVSKISADKLDSQITDKTSKMYKQGMYFKEAESLYGMNALSAFATAKNESASGTSKLAQNKNNIFGFGASDACPYLCAKSYNSVKDSIIDYAKNGLNNYMIAGANYYFGSHAGNKASGRNVKYASDPLWGEKQAAFAYTTDKKNNLLDYKANTIGVTKYDKYNVSVYKDSTGKQKLYTASNKTASLKVYNIAMTVLDKVGDYYKVFADTTDSTYGYVKTSDLNVSNNQPIITATDKTIYTGEKFNILNGVSASDKEDGNLTSKIKTSGNVDTNKIGEYKITYTVTDSSNFSASKEVKIKVESNKPTITAENKLITKNSEFNYLEGVKASDILDGDITNKITYDTNVDTTRPGIYDVNYKVTNSQNKETSLQIKVTVIETDRLIEDGEYVIKSKLDNNMVLDISGGSKLEKANLQLYKENKTDAQTFKIKYLNNGYYTISNKQSDKVLDVDSAGKLSGTNVWQYTNNNTDAQKWALVKNDDNTYSFISKCNGLYLDVAGAKTQNETNIQVYKGNNTNAQKFIFEKVEQKNDNHIVKDGIYVITSALKSDMVLDISGGSKLEKANLQLYKENNTDAQKFKIQFLENDYYLITNIGSDKVLDVTGAGKVNGTNVWQYTRNNTDAQKWKIIKTSDNYYSFISKCNSLYLDVSGAKTQNGTNIQVYKGNNTFAQKFSFKKI